MPYFATTKLQCFFGKICGNRVDYFAHTRHVVNPPRLDSPFDVPRKLPAEHQNLRSDRRRRAKGQHAEPHNVGKKTDDCSRRRPHVRIMTDSAADRRRFLSATPCRQSSRGTLRETDFLTDDHAIDRQKHWRYISD